MYLREIIIRNIRSIEEIDWEVPESKTVGWHVIIGDNGAGKSSFLRSAALALIGPRDAMSLRLPWEDWLRKNEDGGTIDLTVEWDDKIDRFSLGGNTPRSSLLQFGVNFKRARRPPGSVELRSSKHSVNPKRHVWGLGKGWFCAAYGPFRRLTGGDPEFARLSYKLPKLARYLSIFDEKVALTDCIEWIQTLKFQQLEDSRDNESRYGRDLLPAIITFINQADFLPHQARLEEITSSSVLFLDGNEMQVRIEDLSDGYRSILSMTLELIRQLAIAYGPKGVFDPDDPTRVAAPGVVLIDEIDAHLHPAWQRRVGHWFRRHFPNIQFIVTTHSPLICQAAEEGTVFQLPKPGGGNKGGMVRGAKLERLIFGNILDAYSTEAFGQDINRSENSKVMRRRLAELNVKEVREGLTEEELREQERLRGAMPTASTSRDPADDPAP